MNNIPIKRESAVKIKFFHHIRNYLKPFLGVFLIIYTIVLFLLNQGLKLWNMIYSRIYENRKYLIKVVSKLIGLVEIILLIIFLVLNFGLKSFDKDILWWMLRLLIISLSCGLLLWIYHFLIGKENILKEYILLTDVYIEECMAHIVKIYGPPRIGKDTTMISILSILARKNQRVIPKLLARIRKICYVFDFYKVNNACMLYANKFYSSSKTIRRKNFLELVKKDIFKAFLSNAYLNQIDYQEFIDDYENSLDNKVDYKSRWIYNNGISKKHFLEMLNEYMFLYVRLYVLKTFSLTNQPYIEDPKTGRMAKQYSIYYEALSSKEEVEKDQVDVNKKKILDESRKTVKIKFKEKIEAPIIDWTNIGVTENDTWLNNLDNEVKQYIEEYNLRNWKGFYGHYYDFLYYIMVCHDSSRMQKVLRELDAFYINILQRTEILGASKRNFFLGILQKVLNFFAGSDYKMDEENNRILYKNQSKIDYYEHLYQATGNSKYLAMADEIAQKEAYRQPGRFKRKSSELNEKLIEKIERNSYQNGVIRITATISDQPQAVNLKEASLRDLIKRDKPLYHESFKVNFYFRMTDSMGRYNHQCMSGIFENRVEASTLDFSNIRAWPKRMELTKEIMLNMGYPAGHKMFGITTNDIFNARYIPIDGKIKKFDCQGDDVMVEYY